MHAMNCSNLIMVCNFADKYVVYTIYQIAIGHSNLLKCDKYMV